MRPHLFLLAALSLTVLACSSTGHTTSEDDAASLDTASAPEDAAPDTTHATPRPRYDPPYRYLRILDGSDETDAPDGGARIDAIVVRPVGEDPFYAATLEGVELGGGRQLDGPEALNPLGPPSAFDDLLDPDAPCRPDDGTLALGGGWILVGLNNAVVPGDTIIIYDASTCGQPDTAGLDEHVLTVAISDDWTAGWQTIGSGTGPILVITVPDLPVE